MKTIIHVNQHNIKKNRKQEEQIPVITVKQGGETFWTNGIDIKGPSRVVYSPDVPLSCGAHVWIETHSDVVMIDPKKPKGFA